MTAIIDSLLDAGITDIVVWNNAQRDNKKCYGRYLGIQEAKHPYVFHQDDDLVSPVAGLLAAYDPVKDAKRIVAANRPDESWRLTGIGSVFHRSLASVLDRYLDKHEEDDLFHRTCDVTFAYLNRYRSVPLAYEDLPWASDPQSSMYLERDHMEARETMLRRVKELA